MAVFWPNRSLTLWPGSGSSVSVTCRSTLNRGERQLHGPENACSRLEVALQVEDHVRLHPTPKSRLRESGRMAAAGGFRSFGRGCRLRGDKVQQLPSTALRPLIGWLPRTARQGKGKWPNQLDYNHRPVQNEKSPVSRESDFFTEIPPGGDYPADGNQLNINKCNLMACILLTRHGMARKGFRAQP